MLWIKRNLFLAAGSVAAVVLLTVGVLYVMAGLNKNKTLSEEVEGTRTRLNNIYNSPDPFPHATNISAAKAEAAKLGAAVAKTKRHFTPVPADGRNFRALLDKTVDELRGLARDAGTKLPAATYAFSFQTQMPKPSFGPGTVPGVAEQLMEVKELCSILFGARVNQLGNIRRARVSVDDRASTIGGDYLTPVHANQTITAVSPTTEQHPYELTYYCFSSELAQVLNAMARSSYGFTVKALMVEPDSGQLADAGGGAMAAAELAPPPVRPPPGGQGPFGPGPRRGPGANPPPRPSLQPPPRPASDRPVVLLKEKRLKVTMLVYAIK